MIRKIFGWDFDGFTATIQQRLHECIKPLEDDGDAALQSKNPEEAIHHYSVALSLDPSSPAHLFVKRSKARAMSLSWEDALNDADEVLFFHTPVLDSSPFCHPGNQR